ncbi:hypothetical protein D1872_257960 [compost metagenome]
MFRPNGLLRRSSLFLDKMNAQQLQTVEPEGAIQIEKSRFLRRDSPVFPQVESEILRYGGFVLLEFQPF